LDKEENEKVKWYLRPLGVLVLLFVVLGPLALPLLYKSPKFSKTLKIILTIAVIIYTSYLIFVSVELGIEVYRRIEELQNTIG
jgi:polyferredoxin